MSGTPGAGPRAATGEGDQLKRAESPCARHHNRHPLGPGALWHPPKRRSRPSAELSPRRKRKYSDNAAIHLILEMGQTNRRGKIGSSGGVGGRQVQQALQLLTQGQGRDQETYPDDKCKAAGRQVLPTKVRSCARAGLPTTVRPPR
jgi:hypothetical protein